MDRRTASVFYLNVKYGTTKGGVTSGDAMISSKTGHSRTQAGREYAAARVKSEVIGTGVSKILSGNTSYTPVVAGSVVVTDGVEYFTDNGSGSLVSNLSGGYTGTIVYATGNYNVRFLNTPAGQQTIDYKYDYQTSASITGVVPEVNIEVTSSTVTAEDFPVRANYALGAAIDLEKAHGLSLEDEIIKYLGGEVRFTMDHLGIDLISDAASGTSAATTPGTFTATPSSGEPWLWRKHQFIDFVEKANINIISKTLRSMCNFIVTGNDGARIIRQLDDHFKPASGLGTLTPTGPYELGTLDGRLVIHDPLLAASKIIFGFKSDNYMHAAFIFAPYIPLFATPTLVTADLKAQKGFLSSAGYKTVIDGAFSAGVVNGI